MILSACGLAWYFHATAFVVLSLVCLISFRPLVMKRLMKEETKTNADSAIGKEFVLITDIGFDKPGTIKIGDIIWNADTVDKREEIPAGTIVKVVKIEGNKYIVEKV